MWRDWLRVGGPLILVVGGLACIVVASQANLEAHTTRRGWVESGAAQRAEEAVSQPTPIWLPAGAEHPLATLAPAPVPSSPSAPSVTASTIQLIDSGFMFLDPPQPGARARFWLNLRTYGDQPGGPIALAVPLTWFDGYRIASTTPSASIEASTDDGKRRLVFGRLAPGAATLQVDVISTAEGVAPPSVRVELAGSGTAIGEAHPSTVAPRPRPGPISAVHIPRLSLNVAVVPTEWEPPAFVAGEVRGSANVSQGNTVLVGHLTGAAGAVFNHLDELSPGDTIVAVSRGLEYTFVVSDKQTLPADDSGPAMPDGRPRLTLMTCSGTWDPLAHNYSDRLWVTAEPPDKAAATIAENVAQPPTPTPAPETDSSSVTDPNLRAGGLGSTRASFDAAYGPPLGETPDHLVVYRGGATEYRVAFSSEQARAQRIEMLPVGHGSSLNVSVAVQRALAVFPPDAHQLTRGPEAAGEMIVERFDSVMLRQVLGNSLAGAPSGSFLAGYTFDRAGLITRVVVEAGDNPPR